MDYGVVSDEMRSVAVKSAKTAPWLDEIRAGRTVLLKGLHVDQTLGGWRQRLRGQGYVMHSHRTPEGLVVWADQIPTMIPMRDEATPADFKRIKARELARGLHDGR